MVGKTGKEITLTEADLARRKKLWIALAELYHFHDPDEQYYKSLGAVINETGYALSETYHILAYEVHPNFVGVMHEDSSNPKSWEADFLENKFIPNCLKLMQIQRTDLFKEASINFKLGSIGSFIKDIDKTIPYLKPELVK